MDRTKAIPLSPLSMKAWMFNDKDWVRINAADANCKAALMSKASFDHEFGPLPELPTAAFH